MRRPRYVSLILASGIMATANPTYGETRLAPILSVSERYDSNVFFLPKTPGLKLEDFVTSVSPKVLIGHRGNLMEGGLLAGATAEAYANNPDLNYVGGNGSLALNLNRAVNRFFPRTALSVSESFLYTPQAPAFGIGGGEVQNPFTRGIQISRVNSVTNHASVMGSYRLSPTQTLHTSYTNFLMRFGSRFGTQGTTLALFNTNSQTVSAGPAVRVSPTDDLRLTYQYNRVDFPGANLDSLRNHSGSVAWARIWSPEYRSTVSAGATVFERFSGTGAPGGGFVGTISGGAIFPNGSLSLIWERTRGAGSMESGFFSSILLPQAQAGMVSPNLPPISIVGGGMAPTGGPITPTTSRATLSYSVGVFPSIFLAAVPLLSQTVTVTTAHPLTERLSVTGGANFARNDSTSSGSNISFMSYQGDVSVNYLLTSTLKASAVGAYGHYDQQVMSTAVDFDRKVLMLMITKVWDRELFVPAFMRPTPAPEASESDQRGSEKK